MITGPYLSDESFESEAVGEPNIVIHDEDVILHKGTTIFSKTTIFLKNVIMEEGFHAKIAKGKSIILSK